jgi:hypothetical protein
VEDDVCERFKDVDPMTVLITLMVMDTKFLAAFGFVYQLVEYVRKQGRGE